jgi:hypothetical protein
MRKAIIIILALVVALSILPVSFACYNGGWGHWNHFWKPHKVVYCCPSYCNLIFTSVNAYDNDLTSSWEPKEVAETTAYITDCGKKLAVTIDNAYPCYEGTIDFCVKNTGSMAATITGITTDYPNPDYLQINLTGGVQEGVPIQPCSEKCGQLVIGGIPQREDAQNRTFTFTIDIDYECTCTPPGGGCETAFAYGCSYCHCYATCFSYWGFDRWGWSNGPLTAGEYYFKLYAGAAQCDLSNGEKVGWLKINYDGSTAVVTYHMYYGHKMDETHLYVGNEPLPRDNQGDYTVAPGQFPLKHDLNNAWTDQYTVEGLSGEIYVVAHAVVCD